MRTTGTHCSTPQWLFEECSYRWGPFDLDVCAEQWNAKCERYLDQKADGLKQIWEADRVWCNPPWVDISPWVDKALASVLSLSCRRVCLLVPTRTGQRWYERLRGQANIAYEYPVFGPGRVKLLAKPGSVMSKGGFEDVSVWVIELPIRVKRP